MISVQARWLDQPAAPGDWNLAVDDALHRHCGETGRAALRVYRWSVPTLSLGYFQRHRERDGHLPSCHCPLVRRGTGGGAIVHDREITYSLAVPVDPRELGQAPLLIEAAHAAWGEALADWGIRLELWSGPASPPRFLCFQRRSPGDGLVAGHKLLGSAQRRRYGALLQHGSLLLHNSPAAPELPGLAELCSNTPSEWDLVAAWKHALARSLSWDLDPDELSPEEQRDAADGRRERYASTSWTDRR